MEKPELSRRQILTLCAVPACAAMTGLTLWGNKALMTTRYVVKSEQLPHTFSGFRIAQISDLHNAVFGKNNEKLLKVLSENKPDLIVMTGDLIDGCHTNTQVAIHLAERAMEIAPVCYVPGNHEASTVQYEALRDGLRSAGVILLEDEVNTLEIGGETVTILGLADPRFTIWGNAPGEIRNGIRRKLTRLMLRAEGFTILLSHRPELFPIYAGFGINLVLCGHTHGGQIRLPFLGGVFAPGQGLFPRYDAGVYTRGDTTMVISRGLGNSKMPIRINNRPEVVLINLRRQVRED